ncbi:MAG: DUF1905 domain-containing protein [Saprospiraceae bacterium]|jgi:hypothetical protein|nr:DUF1905 domain-containing protein [Candidatus Defluviibacterium haderslevense]MBK7242945.1 DUF1905 domain-containing protein [Candidatus Defluviibacterium haderslevense]
MRFTLYKFGRKGEKSGWTYIEFSEEFIQNINPGVRKTFRVKGKIDAYEFSGLNLLPMGKGVFILPINQNVRRIIKKKENDTVEIEINLDLTSFELDNDFLEYLETEKNALNFFNTLTRSHQNYFSKWISSAKSPITKANRISETVIALSKKQNYSEMIRSKKQAN